MSKTVPSRMVRSDWPATAKSRSRVAETAPRALRRVGSLHSPWVLSCRPRRRVGSASAALGTVGGYVAAHPPAEPAVHRTPSHGVGTGSHGADQQVARTE